MDTNHLVSRLHSVHKPFFFHRLRLRAGIDGFAGRPAAGLIFPYPYTQPVPLSA